LTLDSLNGVESAKTVAKDADVKAMVDFTVDKYGRLDVAFNNAGVEWKGPLEKATEAEYRRIFDINVWGVLNSMRHEIPVMLKNGGGAIVNTSACNRARGNTVGQRNEHGALDNLRLRPPLLRLSATTSQYFTRRHHTFHHTTFQSELEFRL
jgi:NAD(P)-dependent dehydrogenase (short-subunit alcohol dehydrogenase family)